MTRKIIPGEVGQKVRLIHDPAKVGVTTGKIKEGPFTLIQITVGPNELLYKPLDLLELILKENRE